MELNVLACPPYFYRIVALKEIHKVIAGVQLSLRVVATGAEKLVFSRLLVVDIEHKLLVANNSGGVKLHHIAIAEVFHTYSIAIVAISAVLHITTAEIGEIVAFFYHHGDIAKALAHLHLIQPGSEPVFLIIASHHIGSVIHMHLSRIGNIKPNGQHRISLGFYVESHFSGHHKSNIVAHGDFLAVECHLVDAEVLGVETHLYFRACRHAARLHGRFLAVDAHLSHSIAHLIGYIDCQGETFIGKCRGYVDAVAIGDGKLKRLVAVGCYGIAVAQHSVEHAPRSVVVHAHSAFAIG